MYGIEIVNGLVYVFGSLIVACHCSRSGSRRVMRSTINPPGSREKSGLSIARGVHPGKALSPAFPSCSSVHR